MDEDRKKFLRYQRNKILKREVMDAYGGACECCGLDDLVFLTVEHTRKDGAEHRKKTGNRIYEDLKKRNFPQDLGLTVLCWNCQIPSKYNQVCPHKLRRNKNGSETKDTDVSNSLSNE